MFEGERPPPPSHLTERSVCVETSGIDYQIVMTNNADEAISLSEYLNGHGILAIAEGSEVTVPLASPETNEHVGLLKRTWKMRWDHFDSGLFGVPIYSKDL